MDNGREGNLMQFNCKPVPKEHAYAILNLRLKYLERYRQTTYLSDFQVWKVLECIEQECQLQTMWDIGAENGE